jgi:hypothetical protein
MPEERQPNPLLVRLGRLLEAALNRAPRRIEARGT